MKMFNAALTRTRITCKLFNFTKKLLEQLLRCHPTKVIQKTLHFVLTDRVKKNNTAVTIQRELKETALLMKCSFKQKN